MMRSLNQSDFRLCHLDCSSQSSHQLLNVPITEPILSLFSIMPSWFNNREKKNIIAGWIPCSPISCKWGDLATEKITSKKILFLPGRKLQLLTDCWSCPSFYPSPRMCEMESWQEVTVDTWVFPNNYHTCFGSQLLNKIYRRLKPVAVSYSKCLQPSIPKEGPEATYHRGKPS